MSGPAAHTVVSELPIDLRQTTFGLRRGGRGDPSVRTEPAGMWRASRYPSGPATLHLRQRGPRTIRARAWGPGSEEAVAGVARLVGAGDDDGGLGASPHPLVAALARSNPGARLGATGNVLEALVPSILEQKVQGKSARASFCAMVRAHGEIAPAAGSDGPRLLLPPTAEWLVSQPSWAWHRWGVEGRRATTIRTACSYGHRLQHVPVATLTALPGIGAWTVAEVAAAAFGDPDAVSVGDYWLCHWVCHNLEGSTRGTDRRMLELLAPFAGQRGRVCRLIMLGGSAPPRFGPRLPMQSIAAF